MTLLLLVLGKIGCVGHFNVTFVTVCWGMYTDISNYSVFIFFNYLLLRLLLLIAGLLLMVVLSRKL
jgi:hypothetical protein